MSFPLSQAKSLSRAKPLRTFSDLPNELILDIADRLDYAELNRLTRTNKRNYDVLNDYLYRRDLTDLSRPGSSLLWALSNHGYGDKPEATVQRAIAASQHLDPTPESFHIALGHAAGKGEAWLVKLLLEVKGINPNFAFEYTPYSDY